MASQENLCESMVKLSFIDNNGTKHKDLLVDNFVFKWQYLQF